MSKRVLQRSLRALAVAALVAVPALADPTPVPRPPHSEGAVGGTMAEACAAAIQKVKDYCLFYGTITTDPGFCGPVPGTEDRICTCYATASTCIPNHF